MPEEDIEDQLTYADAHYEQFERYVELLQEKDNLKDRLVAVEAELKQREPGLLLIFEQGYQKVTVGNITLSPRREIWARAKASGDHRGALCRALHQVGLGHMVYETCNLMTVSAHVRGLVKNAEDEGVQYETVGQLLPPELDAALLAEPVWKVGRHTLSDLKQYPINKETL